MPDAVTHPNLQELSDFGLGHLPADAAATIAGHLETCPACQQAVAELPPDSFLGKVRASQSSPASVPGSRATALAEPATPPKGLPPELANYPKYRFLRELGRGGMGVVYQAEQTLMGRRVAVKVINPSVLAHPDALPRFQAEVRAAATLDHPNIVRAHDAEQVGGLHLLVMEYVEGTNLANLVQRKGPLPVAHACYFIRQAALGLQHAFEQGMVHRDIKPHNLMVTPKGVVKILDFGLARLRGEPAPGGGLTAAGSFMGTPEYVSPEQATDARTADTRADLYSLGCTLYFLLTGQPPFQEDTAVKLILAHIDREAPPVQERCPEVPAELSAVVARMLAKDPAQRYQQPVEAAQALVPFLNTAPKRSATQVEAPPPRPSAAVRATAMGADTHKASPLPTNVPATSPVQNSPVPAGAADLFADLTGGSPPPVPNTAPVAAPTPAWWRRRSPVLAGLVSGLLVLGLGVWRIPGILSRAKVPATPAGQALVVLEVEPPDAQVSVDGRNLGAPARDDNQALQVQAEPGWHHVQIRKDGFEAVTRDIQWTMEKSAPIKIHLEPVKVAALPPEERPKDPIKTRELSPAKRAPEARRPTIATAPRALPTPAPAPPTKPSVPVAPPDPFAGPLRKAREDYDAALKGAGGRVVDAFDQHLATLAADRKPRDQDRLKEIDALKAEQVAFQKKGTLPWSPRMRSAALEYLQQIQAATLPLEQAYDQALAHQHQAGDDQAAGALAAEKTRILTPKIVGTWDCTGVKSRVRFSYTLYANGRVGTPDGKDTWKLTRDELQITLHRSDSPTGRWIDTCTIAPHGQDFTGKPGKPRRDWYKGKLVRESN